jgi:hypothetical protein
MQKKSWSWQHVSGELTKADSSSCRPEPMMMLILDGGFDHGLASVSLCSAIITNPNER